jgi:hypothetical protein
MKQTTSIKPAYSQVVICDPHCQSRSAALGARRSVRGERHLHSVHVLSGDRWADGLTFGDGDDVRVHGDPICERMLKTPGRQIASKLRRATAYSGCPPKGPRPWFGFGPIAAGCRIKWLSASIDQLHGPRAILRAAARRLPVE